MTPRLLDRGPDELSAADLYELARLRQQVFVVEQSSPYPDLDGRDLEPSTRHLTLHQASDRADVLVGCLRLLDDRTHLRIGRVAVARSHRGRGLSRLLVDAAMARVGDRACRLDAQTGLTGFYAGWGFAVDAPEFVEDGVPHVPMLRPATDG